MRMKKETKNIVVSTENHTRLTKDKEHFQKVIGGGTWSINDVITEYYKIMKNYDKGGKK